jgi:hypothetical protein
MNATTEAAPDLVAPLKTEQDLQRIVDEVDAVIADLRKALGMPGPQDFGTQQAGHIRIYARNNQRGE